MIGNAVLLIGCLNASLGFSAIDANLQSIAADEPTAQFLATCQSHWSQTRPAPTWQLRQMEKGLDGDTIQTAVWTVRRTENGLLARIEAGKQVFWLSGHAGAFDFLGPNHGYRFDATTLFKGHLNLPVPTCGLYGVWTEFHEIENWSPLDGDLMSAGACLALLNAAPTDFLEVLGPLKMDGEPVEVLGRSCHRLRSVPPSAESPPMVDVVLGQTPEITLDVDIQTGRILALQSHVQRFNTDAYHLEPWLQSEATFAEWPGDSLSKPQTITATLRTGSAPPAEFTYEWAPDGAETTSSGPETPDFAHHLLLEVPLRPSSVYLTANKESPDDLTAQVHLALSLGLKEGQFVETDRWLRRIVQKLPRSPEGIEAAGVLSEAFYQELPEVCSQLAMAALESLNQLRSSDPFWLHWEQRLRVAEAKTALIRWEHVGRAHQHLDRLQLIGSSCAPPYPHRELLWLVRRLGLRAFELNLLAPEITYWRTRVAAATSVRQQASSYHHLLRDYQNYTSMLTAEGRLEDLREFFAQERKLIQSRLREADLVRQETDWRVAFADRHKHSNSAHLTVGELNQTVAELVGRLSSGDPDQQQAYAASFPIVAEGLLVLPTGMTQRQLELLDKLSSVCSTDGDRLLLMAIKCGCLHAAGDTEGSQELAREVCGGLLAPGLVIEQAIREKCRYWLGDYAKEQLARDAGFTATILPRAYNNEALLLTAACVQRLAGWGQRPDLLRALLDHCRQVIEAPEHFYTITLALTQASKPLPPSTLSAVADWPAQLQERMVVLKQPEMQRPILGVLAYTHATLKDYALAEAFALTAAADLKDSPERMGFLMDAQWFSQRRARLEGERELRDRSWYATSRRRTLAKRYEVAVQQGELGEAARLEALMDRLVGR